jgi:predicted dehydrogenase
MQKQASIAVIGCGSIGSRHIQALGKLNIGAVVYGLDLSGAAVERAAALFEESKRTTRSPAAFVGAHAYSELPGTLDVAIVATRANVRLSSIEQLLEGRQIRHLVLEKFLFVRREHFATARRLLSPLPTTVWVNCPRRIYAGYRDIAEQLRHARFVSMHVSASARIAPIATIGIHFADLLEFLCGGSLPSLRMSLRDASVVPGNRQLSDFAGILEVTCPGRAHLRYDAIVDTDAPHLVSIISDKARYVIEEREQRMHWSSAATAWKLETREFPIPVQSALTHLLVEELLWNGSCGLTPYAISAAIHVALFDSIIDAFRVIEDDPLIEELPIT